MPVTDADGFEQNASVFVDINNVLLPPVADADSDHVIAPGITVTLNGDSYVTVGTVPSVLMKEFTTPAIEERVILKQFRAY